MFDYTITNEAELFCSNLSFRMNDEMGSKYMGDPSRKQEDAIKILTARLDELKLKYYNILKTIDDYGTSDQTHQKEIS